MLLISNLSYRHPDQSLLFESLNLSVNRNEKISIIGNNGVGKSTFLKLIAGLYHAAGGHITTDSQPYYVPQHFGQYNELTVTQALGIDGKLRALQEILSGSMTKENMDLLNEDWTIEERASAAMAYWQLDNIGFNQNLSTLSGGQKTRLFLAGTLVAESMLILLDEPGNHLDRKGRQLLADFIRQSSATIIFVSHDRNLLNLADTTIELSKHGLRIYGGNYDFYLEQKQVMLEALDNQLHEAQKSLRKAREKERETIERQQKLDSRGKQKKEKAGVARIMMKTLKNTAEKSTAKLQNVHAEKLQELSANVKELRDSMPDLDKMKFNFDNSILHKGKVLFTGNGLNHYFHNRKLWGNDMDLEIRSGERIALKGANGSGKTTLIRIILESLQPSSGNIYSASSASVYIDQDYSIIENDLTVYEQAEKFNNGQLHEHEIKIRLKWFLFSNDNWSKRCRTLSGGEKMRLLLCCLTIYRTAPDVIILDEPTNNLDIRNIEILTSTIKDYEGTLIVVSHDEWFLNEIKVERVIHLNAVGDS